MSLTLPYSTAVNCKFVTLPDQLASTDNTLKLYNIDGSVPGGDSYTKAESDARYLQLVSATNQTISQTPTFANKMTLQAATGKTTIRSQQTGNVERQVWIPPMSGDGYLLTSQNTNTTDFGFSSKGTIKATAFEIFSVASLPEWYYSYTIQLPSAPSNYRTITFPLVNADCELMLTNPVNPQTVDRLNLKTGVFLKGATNTNYIQITSADQVDNNKYVRIPVMDAGGDMVVTNPTTGQTFAKKTTFDNGARVGSLEIFNSTYTNSITITTPISGNKTATIPNLNSGCAFVVTSPNPLTQTIQGNVGVGSLTLNGNQITDLVTTVTGASDTNVPSEKAVKTYVDARATSNLVDNSYTITSTTVTGPTIPSSTIFTTGYRKYCFSWNKDGDATGVKVLNTWTLPDDTFSNISIQGISHLQIPGNSNVSHFKWTGDAILILGSATAAISSYANGGHWSDYDPGTTYPTIIAAGGKNVSLVLNCDSTGNRSKGVFTIETWNIGS